MSAADLPGDLPEVARLAARLCEIPSPSREEGEIAGVVGQDLAAMGAAISTDGAGERIGAGCDNIVARWEATGPGTPIALIAHLDTVPNVGPIEVEVVDGHLTNRHPTILGGDDKAAIAAMIVGVRRLLEQELPHPTIELVLTPCEEIGLRGAAALDPGLLQARMGFVFDHTGPIGDIIGAAPTLSTIDATFVGRAAHAGIQPELGRSAVTAAGRAISRMPLGRVGPETTANIGTIGGGTATNVVAERCSLTAEARSVDEALHARQVTEMLDALTWASSECEVDLETRVERQFAGYRLSRADPQVSIAWAALERVGLSPGLVTSGGGSDANALLANGFPAVNLCNAMEDVHTPDERIAISALERMVEVTIALVVEAAGR